MLRLFLFLTILCFTTGTYAQTSISVPKSEDSLVMFLRKQPKDTLYVWALRPYTLIQINKYADYRKADSLANEMLKVSQQINYGRGIYFHYLIKAIIHNQKSEAQQSLENFLKSYEAVKSYQLPVSLEEASLNNVAIAYEQLGNREKALEYAMRAIKVQEKPGFPEKWLDAGPYGLVSGLYKFKKQFKEAERYTNMAFEIAKKKQDKTGMAIHKNKLGNILDDQDLKNEALNTYLEGLKLAEEAEYPLLQTDLLDNIGRMLTDLKRYNEAEVYLRKNEALCQQLESPIASSSAFHSLGVLYKAQGKNDLAVRYFEMAFEKSKSLSDEMKILNAATSLSETYAAMGQYKIAYRYLLEANVANDSLFSAESDERIQELLTRYETEKKEAAIAQLEIEKKQANLRFLLLAVLGVLALVSAMLLFRNYRSGQRIKALEATQNLRNRISADLHDEIGSTLSSISILSEMLAIQQQSGNLKPQTMWQISEDARNVIDKMDDIIWTINPDNDQFQNLETRLKSFAIPLLEAKNIDFEFSFVKVVNQNSLEMSQRRSVYLILKEAINNAIKYSEATRLEVTANQSGQLTELSVKDNGKGFDTDANRNRNGIRNMRRRAKEIQASLIVDSRVGEGTTVSLRL